MKLSFLQKTIVGVLAAATSLACIPLSACGEVQLTYQLSQDKTHYIVSGSTNNNAVQTVDIPAEYQGLPVTEIAATAFNGCSRLSSVTMADSVTTMGYTAFGYCSRLVSVKLSANLTAIPRGAFAYCTAIPRLTLPDGLESIGESAFFGSGLKEISLPASVKTIGSAAFKDCPYMTSIYIPLTVESVACNFMTSSYYDDTVKRLLTGYYLDPAKNQVQYEGSAEQFKDILQDVLVYNEEGKVDESKSQYAKALISLADKGVVVYNVVKQD